MLVIFFFNDTATTEIYTLSLHDALPILIRRDDDDLKGAWTMDAFDPVEFDIRRGRRSRNKRDQAMLVTYSGDRKSTRLNSSHANISYAVFCLKKKKNKNGIRLT